MTPNFIIVGAAKAGTTSLFHYLNAHPDIYIPERKECRFFSQMNGDFTGPGSAYQNDVIESYQQYLNLFADQDSRLMMGDISNDYLYYSKRTIKNILKYVGKDVKIIIVLRNPVRRAFSNYCHHLREGWEELTFQEALRQEDKRFSENWAWPWYYKRAGLYFNQVQDYLNSFENVKVYLYEQDFLTSSFFSDLFSFLGVDNSVQVDANKIYNRSGKPRFSSLQKLIKSDDSLIDTLKKPLKVLIPKPLRNKIRKKVTDLNLEKIEISLEAKAELEDYFSNDVRKLEALTEKNLNKIWGF